MGFEFGILKENDMLTTLFRFKPEERRRGLNVFDWNVVEGLCNRGSFGIPIHYIVSDKEM